MNILLYCYAFSPSIGGIETVTETLARNLTKLGHSCVVTTETASASSENFPFDVVRKPGYRTILKLMRKADVICNIELSLKFFLLSKIARKPLIWIHNGYKLVSIDALGWYKNEPAPMQPWKSFLFYCKKEGLVYAVKEGFKLYFRRWASANIFCNVAGSEWISKRQPLKNQVQIYAPFPVREFAEIAGIQNKIYDFVFLGRLVPEKGVQVLLKAFQKLVVEKEHQQLKLAIIGYGAAENLLKSLSRELGISKQVDFLGSKKGKPLLDIISRSEVAVIPSYWEEPFGGVALQMLAAGRMMIVSENGGLKEVVGNLGLTFTNGNEEELFLVMKEVLENRNLKINFQSKREDQLKKFDPTKLTIEFERLFERALRKRTSNKSFAT
jgi:glycosyltransferase involved in cell wall biosynthesis